MGFPLFLPKVLAKPSGRYRVPGYIQEYVDYITPGLKLIASGKAITAGARAKCNDDVEKRGFYTNANSPFSGPIFGKSLKGVTIPTNISTLLLWCDTAVTPFCIAAIYNITQATLFAIGNKLGIFEEGDYYSAEDLVEFFGIFAQNIPLDTIPELQSVDGGHAPGLYTGGESDLDFQILYPIIYP